MNKKMHIHRHVTVLKFRHVPHNANIYANFGTFRFQSNLLNLHVFDFFRIKPTQKSKLNFTSKNFLTTLQSSKVLLEETKVMDWITINGKDIDFFMIVENSFTYKRTGTCDVTICQDNSSDCIYNETGCLRRFRGYKTSLFLSFLLYSIVHAILNK
jgi:hypothetical protein